MEYFVDINGQTKGPYTIGQLRSMWSAGTITGTTLYCQEGFSEWVPLSDIRSDLEQSPRPAPPAIQVPTAASRPLAPQPRSSGVGKALGLGCLGIIGLFVLLAIIGAISGGGGGGARSPVVQSAWDGSVSQVKQWLMDNAKDPDSLQFIEWSPVETLPSGFAVRVKYRAKNSFGGYVVENKLFIMDSSGVVLGSKDY